ncbi:putative Diguanylate cyclase [uncultured Eubacteriales bacterium]|uniref:Putative Diguanylate cyclase n=1 Tax=uncultured Eubacteriales bacterium TaxID=172733 RepID=A0A212JNX2_9FIRM|nr:putative Diguanylate cyclase [uncultured Eubacteriales bacterium]
MGRRTAAIGAALGAGLSLLAEVLLLCDYGSRAPWMLPHAVLLCILGAIGAGLIVLASRLFLQAPQSAAERGQFYLLSHFANTFLFEYRFQSRVLTFSDNLPQELGLGLHLEGADCSLRLCKLIHREDRHKLRAMAENPPAPKDEALQELRLLHSGGSYVWYECRVAATYDRHGRPMALLGRFENIDARKRREANLVARSTRDDLTGLLNRSAVTLRVEEWTQSPRAKEGGALFMLDLDNFKSINDSQGHATGDRALRLTARVLRDTFRESDILGRAGGDEFLVFMPGVSSPELASSRAERLCRTLSEQPFDSDNVFPFTCSVGISLFPQDGNSYAALFEAADAAMYQAKREGKNSYRLSSSLADSCI